MRVIAQLYDCSITSLFLLKMRLKILKNDCNQIQISVFENGLHFGEHFYSSSEQVSISSKLYSPSPENYWTEAFAKINVFMIWMIAMHNW